MSIEDVTSKNAKTHRARRALKERESKIVENEKSALHLKGPNCSDIVVTALKDLCKLKEPAAKMLTKRNMTRPFEDQSTMEFLSKINDSSLFLYGSHQKKRPHNLVFGRLFEHQVIDLLEAGIDPETFRSMADCVRSEGSVLRVGSKPIFVFNGEPFENNPDFQAFKNILLDYFRGEVLDKINLASLDRLIVCTAVNDQVFFRHYGILLKKSGTKFPRIELELAGPSLDFKIRRRKEGSSDLRKEAMKTHKASNTRIMAKNVEEGDFGSKAGRVFMERQDLAKLNVKRMKGLSGKRKSEGVPDGKSDADGAEDAVAGTADGGEAKQATKKPKKATPGGFGRAAKSKSAPKSAPSQGVHLE